MVRLPTLRFSRLARVVVVVHGREAPSESDWTEFLERAWRYEEAQPIASFVITDGSGPNAIQRGMMVQRLEYYGKTPAAIVTASRKARLIGTAVKWFIPDMRFFAPHEIEKALAFLGLEGDERATTIRAGLDLIADGWAPAWEARLQQL